MNRLQRISRCFTSIRRSNSLAEAYNALPTTKSIYDEYTEL